MTQPATLSSPCLPGRSTTDTHRAVERKNVQETGGKGRRDQGGELDNIPQGEAKPVALLDSDGRATPHAVDLAASFVQKPGNCLTGIGDITIDVLRKIAKALYSIDVKILEGPLGTARHLDIVRPDAKGPAIILHRDGDHFDFLDPSGATVQVPSNGDCLLSAFHGALARHPMTDDAFRRRIADEGPALNATMRKRIANHMRAEPEVCANALDMEDLNLLEALHMAQRADARADRSAPLFSSQPTAFAQLGPASPALENPDGTASDLALQLAAGYIRQPGTHATQIGDLSVQTLFMLVAQIYDVNIAVLRPAADGGFERAASLMDHRPGRPTVHLVQRGDHYDFAAQNGDIVPVARDGDCAFAAIHRALADNPGLPDNVRAIVAQNLDALNQRMRNAVADTIEAHPDAFRGALHLNDSDVQRVLLDGLATKIGAKEPDFAASQHTAPGPSLTKTAGLASDYAVALAGRLVKTPGYPVPTPMRTLVQDALLTRVCRWL
ncbi:MAG: OTU domain-containing protein, partial [Pseudomonadota bacterium]